MSETPSNDSEFGRLVKIIKDNQGLCPCGHTLAGDHNSKGCYARASYDPLTECDCDFTDDDDDWAAVALASKLVHEGLMYTWVTDEGSGGVDQEDLHPFGLLPASRERWNCTCRSGFTTSAFTTPVMDVSRSMFTPSEDALNRLSAGHVRCAAFLTTAIRRNAAITTGLTKAWTRTTPAAPGQRCWGWSGMPEPLTNKAALDAVRALHRREQITFQWASDPLWYCRECQYPWPCATIQAIGGEK